MDTENMEQGGPVKSIQLTGGSNDLSIYMCKECGMRYAKDVIPFMTRGMEQEVVFVNIPFCPTCHEDIEAVNGLKLRMDLPTSIGSIVGGM